ncbi:MAG TPA: hypothetical protein VFG37_05895 [Planctomycetota bacterium]|nr:hypothetical protein [Planctomycetota bacterium]
MIGLLFAFAAAQPAPQAKAAPPAKAPPVAIVGDADDARLRKRAHEAAESAWKAASALWGGDGAPSEKEPSLHLYREIADYEKACDRLVGGSLKQNLAFTEWTNSTAHVVLQPPIRGDAEKRLAPTWTTLRLVAHESAHLARFCVLPNAASHPGWIADGAATWVETLALAERGHAAPPDDVPFFATDELRAQRLLKAGKLPGFGDLLLDRTDALDFYERYAVRGLLFRFLMDGPHAQAFRPFLGDVRHEGGGDDFKERVAAALQKRLGASDWKAVDAEFRAWIEKLAPKWEQLYRTLEIDGDDWTQCAFDDVNAMAFRTAPAGEKPYAVEGSVTLYADRSKGPQANLLLGREVGRESVNRFLSIALVPGVDVTLFDFDGGRAADSQWKRLGYAQLAGTAVGKPLAFRVDCAPNGGKTEVALAVDGKPIARVTVERVLDGPWGVGAQAGSSCVWRDVKLVAAGAK